MLARIITSIAVSIVICFFAVGMGLLMRKVTHAAFVAGRTKKTT
jgi:hypothetical protein